MTGARQDVVCKIFGENLDTLALYAQKLGGLFRTVEGATEFYVEAVNGMPQVVIRYNRDAMAQYGLDVETIDNTVNAAFAGAVAGKVFEGERRFDLAVRVQGEGPPHAERCTESAGSHCRRCPDTAQSGSLGGRN
jgi:cobalt-zinc-cadmium resistance protein CzcA